MPENFSFTAPSFSTWDSSSGVQSLPPFAPMAGNRRRLFPAKLSIAENCRFSQEGGVQIRLGCQNQGSLGTGVKVDSIQGFETDNFKVLFTKSGTKIFQSNNPDVQTPTYYDIGVTRTTSQKDFFFAKRKDMIATNQVDDELRIFTTILSADADVPNLRFTIPKGDTDDLQSANPVSFTASSSVFTAAAHGMINGDIVNLVNVGGALPAGLAVSTTYYVVNVTTNTFQLALTSGGAAIVTGDDGSAAQYFILAKSVYIRGIRVTYIKPVIYTADAGADTLTASNHGVVNGTIVTVSNVAGAVPTGLTAGTTYFVINATANTFQLASVLNGPAIDITNTGSGINTFVAEDGIIRACIGLTTNMISGDIVTQTTAYPNNPKASCMSELLGSCLVGGVLSDPTALDYSVQSTRALPGNFFDFTSTGSGNKPMPRDITALLAGTSVTLIGLQKGLNYATDFDADGALITASLNTVHSIPNAKCITQTDEDFAILTADGRILPVGQTNAGFKVLEDPKNVRVDLDYPIQKFVQKIIDKTNTSNNFQHYDSSMRVLSNCIQTLNGITTELILSTDTGGWSNDTTRSFSCKTIFKGRTYCGSDNTDIIYLNDETLQDDGNDIGFRIVTGQMNFGSARVSLDIMKITIGGLLSAIGEFIVNVYIDSKFAYTETITAQMLIEKGLMSTDSGSPIGGGQVGSERVGDGGAGIEAFPFICPLDVTFECRTIQLEIISTDAIEIRNFDIDVEHEGEELFDTL